ncbi:MAG: hypothetical protein EA385_00390 [Salinarimonadaceae bacterium]|nr:MAG: hypothetical protein EA385_00390 [Salinarimonadaceae bacterium]
MFAVLSVLAIVCGAIGILVAGVFWLMPSKRPRAKYVQATSIIAIVAGVIGVNVEIGREATAAGFTSRADQRAAAAEGVEDGAAWYALLDARKREEGKRVAAAKAAERAACRSDFTCWGRDRRIDAEVRCKREIERQARYAHEWTSSWTEPMFSRFAWQDQEAGVMTYFGDRLRFQNGFGAWVNMSYSCDYDTERDVAVQVRAGEGRL